MHVAYFAWHHDGEPMCATWTISDIQFSTFLFNQRKTLNSSTKRMQSYKKVKSEFHSHLTSKLASTWHRKKAIKTHTDEFHMPSLNLRQLASQWHTHLWITTRKILFSKMDNNERAQKTPFECIYAIHVNPIHHSVLMCFGFFAFPSFYHQSRLHSRTWAKNGDCACGKFASTVPYTHREHKNRNLNKFSCLFVYFSAPNA